MAFDRATTEQELIQQIQTGDGSVTTGMFAGRNVLLLHTVGAKSGEPRMTPLVFSEDAGKLVIIASKNGSPTHPAWYNNIVKAPLVTIEVGGEKFQAKATVVPTEDERRRLYDQHAELHESFTTYEALTQGRVIPVVLLDRVPGPVAA
ncbi:MAG: nitroreductase family deazaflavin-dependent oxidoreductase [Chloroflexi bacterium]|nr:nitroreductase family deazaflavin-dependent oxidoreductase [Chloroflexota bacterium]